VKQGKLQVLLVTSEARVANFPDTPTVIELGLSEMKDDIWQGFFAPAKTPPAIIQKLNQALNQALKSPEVIEKLEQNDFVMLGGTPKQASDFISSEVVRWGKIATEVSALPMQ
jgi:tripartite-type tricarboxylate transporter receptor subunit TctC